MEVNNKDMFEYQLIDKYIDYKLYIEGTEDIYYC